MSGIYTILGPVKSKINKQGLFCYLGADFKNI